MRPPLLKAEGLTKRYGGVLAADNIGLELARGEVLGIMGPNGAGKSTLIGMLGGALPASAGRIFFDGEDVTALPAPERARRGIGRTYQIPRPFLEMTVQDNLLAARYSLHPFERSAKANAACGTILERCGLADAAALKGRELPLLRRKRLEVARALALEPRLLMLDEVGAGLIDAEVSELIALVQSLRGEVPGIIIIEHVLRVVRECCERLVVINFGRKFAEGPTAEVMASDEVAAVYLGAAHGGGAGMAPAAAADADAPVAPAATAPTAQAASAVAGLLGPALRAPAAGAATAPPPVLALKGIHAGYGQARVLNGIDLTVRAGQVVAVLGANGAGKTTLAQVVGGSLRPSAGQRLIDGVDATGWPAHRIARQGLAQCMEGRRIFAPLSVEENLLLPVRGLAPPERAGRLDRVYALFPDLAQRRHQGGTAMSGGQQQMLAIARALMAQPRLVLFDEISLGLAPIMMDRLYAALAELRAAGLTMVIVEQDVERALALADEVHVMEHGRIVLSGTADAIRRDSRLRHAYMGAAA